MRLRRWHFDVAIFVGLGVFVAAYLLAQPRAMWRVPLGKVYSREIGFSPDARTYYLLKDVLASGDHVPKPMIQAWNVAKGVLESELPLQLPAEVAEKVKPQPNHDIDFFYPQLIPGTKHAQIRILDVAFRLFDLETGQCIPSAVQTEKWFWYLMQNPEDQHYWGITAGNGERGESPRVIDLATGRVLHAFSNVPGHSLSMCTVSRDKQYLLMVWMSGDRQWPTKHTLQVVPIKRWNESELLPIEPCELVTNVILHQDTIYATPHVWAQQFVQARPECFRRDAQTGKFQKQKTPAWLVPGKGESLFLMQEVVIKNKLPQDDGKRSELMEKIEEFFGRLGIRIRRPDQWSFFVHDLHTGRLVRQLTGFTETGSGAANLAPSEGGEYLSYIMRQDNGQQYLVMYRIPHHLWERSLHFLQYAAWVLVVPWPGRYWVRRERQG